MTEKLTPSYLAELERLCGDNSGLYKHWKEKEDGLDINYIEDYEPMLHPAEKINGMLSALLALPLLIARVRELEAAMPGSFWKTDDIYHDPRTKRSNDAVSAPSAGDTRK